MAAQENSYINVAVSLNSQTISEDLRALLNGSAHDRLFITFRQAHGHMVAASHGRYYSMSDIDWRSQRPLQGIDMSSMVPHTCLNSTDALVREAEIDDWVADEISRDVEKQIIASGISVLTTAQGFFDAKQIAADISQAMEGSVLPLAVGHVVSVGFLRASARRMQGGQMRRIDQIFRVRVAL